MAGVAGAIRALSLVGSAGSFQREARQREHSTGTTAGHAGPIPVRVQWVHQTGADRLSTYEPPAEGAAREAPAGYLWRHEHRRSAHSGAGPRHWDSVLASLVLLTSERASERVCVRVLTCPRPWLLPGTRTPSPPCRMERKPSHARHVARPSHQARGAEEKENGK